MDTTPRVVNREERLAEAQQALHSVQLTLQSGHPVQAFQELLQVTHYLGGDQGPLLKRALEALSQGGKGNVEDLAQLLTQCNLSIAQGSSQDVETTQSSPSAMEHDRHMSSGGVVPGSQQESILAETGREEIAGAAMDDGSSFICRDCGGVVSRSRADAHRQHWCAGVQKA